MCSKTKAAQCHRPSPSSWAANPLCNMPACSWERCVYSSDWRTWYKCQLKKKQTSKLVKFIHRLLCKHHSVHHISPVHNTPLLSITHHRNLKTKIQWTYASIVFRPHYATITYHFRFVRVENQNNNRDYIFFKKLRFQNVFRPHEDEKPQVLWGAGMTQWWERLPPTNVYRVRFPDPASYVGWVCCWFSSLLREVFLGPGTPVFPSPQNPTFPNSNSIWIIAKHFIMSLWLGWLRKHSLCLTLNLHFFLKERFRKAPLIVTD